MVKVSKQDSNDTGLRYCEEASLGVLPAAADQVWYPAEPNSYSNFGGQIKTVARTPINSARQNQKGVVVDLDASGGYNSDLTKTNLLRLMQGFMFADFREPWDSQSFNKDNGSIFGVLNATSKFEIDVADYVTGVLAQALVYTSGFSNAANNGVFVASAAGSATAATGVLTSTLNYVNGDTVTIGGRTYTFKTALTPADGEVLVGATEAASMNNLTYAINNSGGTPGTDYYVLAADTNVTAANDGLHAVTVTAIKKGYGANSIATTEVAANAAWGGGTLSGGTGDVTVTAATLVDEASPPSAARVQVVGYQFASGTLDVSMSFTLPRLVRASGAVDFTTLGLVPGQFVFIGGDTAGQKFVNVANNGWARVKSVAASYIELDKTTSTMVAETGTGLTVNLYFGKVLKNEANDTTLIKRRSYQLERDLGQYDTSIAGHQGEYLVGAIANEFTLNVKQADKVNADLTFVAADNTQVTQSTGLKSAAAGSAPALVSEDAYNTTSHVSRMRMTILDPTNANPTPLFAYLMDFTIVVNNNVTPDKAVAVLGAFDMTAGYFDVSGKVTAYFADVTAAQAVRNNSDVSLDVAFARDNSGLLFDVPLTALGDGRLNVQQNKAIEIPLDMNAGADRVFNHTLLMEYFPYLPDAAM